VQEEFVRVIGEYFSRRDVPPWPMGVREQKYKVGSVNLKKNIF